MSGALDAIKWSAKWRNWNISDLLFSLSSIEGTKAAEANRNICAVYGDHAIGESTARKWCSSFKEDRYDISDTLHSGRPSGFDEDRLNTLIHKDPRQCTRELANVMNCDHSTIVRHFIQWARLKKIRCMGTASSKPEPQKSAGGHKISSACSSLIGS